MPLSTTATSRRAPDLVGDTHARQRDEFGGLNWGAAFFGWLVAVGVATLLTAILSAAGAAIGLTNTSTSQATDSASTIGIVGGILFLLVLLVAYFAGGYVAGRMSRFDGPRQGASTRARSPRVASSPSWPSSSEPSWLPFSAARWALVITARSTK